MSLEINSKCLMTLVKIKVLSELARGGIDVLHPTVDHLEEATKAYIVRTLSALWRITSSLIKVVLASAARTVRSGSRRAL